MKDKKGFIIVNRDKLTTVTADLTHEIITELNELSSEQGSPNTHIGEMLLLAMFSARLCVKFFGDEDETETTNNESEAIL